MEISTLYCFICNEHVIQNIHNTDQNHVTVMRDQTVAAQHLNNCRR